MAVQVDHVGARHRDARALGVVRRFAVRHDHVQAVHGAALEEADESAAARRAGGLAGGSVCCPGQEQGIEAQAKKRYATGSDEDASCDVHMTSVVARRPACPPIVSETPARPTLSL